MLDRNVQLFRRQEQGIGYVTEIVQRNEQSNRLWMSDTERIKFHVRVRTGFSQIIDFVQKTGFDFACNKFRETISL